MEQNPYAPPIDNMPPAAQAGEDGFIEGGRGVDAGRGAAWLTEGWELVKGNVGSWILISFLYLVLAIVLIIIPVVGQLAYAFLIPVFSAGLVLGCRDVSEGRDFGVGALFAGFNHAGGLLVICLIHLGQALFLAGLGLVLGVGGAFNTQSPFAPPAGNPLDPGKLQGLAIFMVATVVIGIPVGMATYYAPALVAIRGMAPGAAVKNSFLGASKNVLPFIVYCLLAFLFSIAAILPCGFGFLVLVPVMFASIYVGYRDIFFTDPSS